jgi:hypothetical protein
MSDDEDKDLVAPEQVESTPDNNEEEDNAGAKPNGEGKGRKKTPEVPIEQLYDLSKPIPKVRLSVPRSPLGMLLLASLSCHPSLCLIRFCICRFPSFPTIGRKA